MPGAVVSLVPELAEAAVASAAGALVKVPVGCATEAPSFEAAAVPVAGAVCGEVADEDLSLARRRSILGEDVAEVFWSDAPRVSTDSPDAAFNVFSCA